MEIRDLVELGLDFEINLAVLNKYGLHLKIDGTDAWIEENDAEGGVMMTKEEYAEGHDRLTSFVRDRGGKVISDRVRLIGSIIQPPPNAVTRPAQETTRSMHVSGRARARAHTFLSKLGPDTTPAAAELLLAEAFEAFAKE